MRIRWICLATSAILVTSGLAIAQGQAAQRVVRPIVECREVAVGGGSVVWFGYQNDWNTTIAIPAGASNMFVPPIDRGQPQSFLPGRQAKVFRVPLGTLGTLVWVVASPNGTVRSVTANTATPLCPATSTTTLPPITTTSTTSPNTTSSTTTIPTSSGWSVELSTVGSAAVLCSC